MGSDRKRAPRLTLRGKLAVLAAAALAAYVLLSSRTNSDVILLRNAAGSEVHILKHGAIIQKLLVPDRDGNFADVVLGFDDEARYLHDSPYFGAVVGRVANRIANATFTLDGATYRLATNEGGMPGTLHGGARGFDKVAWNVLHRTADKVVLEYTAADGEEGYPGELHVKVRYELTARSELVFEVTAHTTKPTPINIAQHSYFNLGGHGSGSVFDHVLTLHKATHVLPIDSHRIPRGLQPSPTLPSTSSRRDPSASASVASTGPAGARATTTALLCTAPAPSSRATVRRCEGAARATGRRRRSWRRPCTILAAAG